MRTKRLFVGLVVLAGALVFLAAPAVRAANNPIFRDCSAFVSGFDPDFLHLSGVTVNPTDGSLTVSPSQNSVELTASESFDPGDNAGHVTLIATITAPGIPAETVQGTGTDFVVLHLPMLQSGVGQVYTISWAATFDNGNHTCPSLVTPENTPSQPNPFVITVSNGSGS